MIYIRQLNWRVLAGAAMAVTMGLSAHAEMVFENDVPATAPVTSGTATASVATDSQRPENRPENKAEERGSLRQVIGVSERAQVTAQAQQQSQIHVGPARAVETEEEPQNVSQSERLRRERVREELKNEDLLQSRLEELRIRDERRRMGELMNVGHDQERQPAREREREKDAPIQEQVVVAPITERVGSAASAPALASTQPSVVNAPVSTAVATSMSEEHSDRTILSVQPRAGLGDMRANDIYYVVRPRFASGLSLGLVTSDNLSFELGYTYAEYGVTMAGTNPFIMNGPAYGYSYTPETVALKQNVFDAGLKLHFLGPESKLRPFLGGGAAYSVSFLNYDQRILDVIARNPALYGLGGDYQVNAFEGYLSGGLDLRINKSISLGVTGKYYQVLSASERNGIYFYNGAGPDQDKQYVGGSLARTSFFTIMGGATFTF